MGRNLICIGHKNQHNDAELQIIYNNIFTLAAFARTRKQVKNAGTPVPPLTYRSSYVQQGMRRA